VLGKAYTTKIAGMGLLELDEEIEQIGVNAQQIANAARSEPCGSEDYIQKFLKNQVRRVIKQNIDDYLRGEASYFQQFEVEEEAKEKVRGIKTVFDLYFNCAIMDFYLYRTLYKLMEIDVPEVIVIYAGATHTWNACEFLESISGMKLEDKYNYYSSNYEKLYGGKLSEDNFVEISPFQEHNPYTLRQTQTPLKNNITFIDSTTENHCASCKKSLGYQPSVCSGCRNSFYCDRICQSKNWPKHKEICLYIKKYVPK